MNFHKMKILCANVAGLRAALKKGFGSVLLSEDPDIICLQEVKCGEEDIELPDGYYVLWNKGNVKGQAGVAMLSKQKPIKTYSCQEGRIVTMHFESFSLTTVYVLNSGRSLEERIKWNKSFSEYLSTLGGNIILCGDMNVAHKDIDIHNPKGLIGKPGFTKEERDDFDILLSKHKLIDLWRKQCDLPGYTFWSYLGNAKKNDKGWRLDYFLCRGMMGKMEILRDVNVSDHCPITLII